MYKYIITSFLLVASLTMKAQFAMIIDKDGYVNGRALPSTKSKVRTKIKSNEIVYISDKRDANDNWNIVDYYDDNGQLQTVYIHKSRLKLIDTFEQIPLVLENQQTSKFYLDPITIEIKIKIFDSKDHRADLTVKDNVRKYKSHEIWGYYIDSIPQLHYDAIVITYRQHSVSIPLEDMEGLFDVNLENSYCYYDRMKDSIYITAMNSDGGEAYEVLFIIHKGKYIGKKVFGFS